jgi:hypothetical protein
MTQYASIESNQAWLAYDFGYNMAVRYFGQELIDTLPTKVRGKNKGKLRGTLEWEKVVKGGWISNGFGGDSGPSGRVERRVGKVIEAKLVGEDGKVIKAWYADLLMG